MFSNVNSLGIFGIDPYDVLVETDLSTGMPSFEIVGLPDAAVKEKPARTTFQAVKGKYRKPGTGCVSQISDQLWEGRYSPKVNGKRMARNVYAHSEEECEEKLAELIEEMKEELAALRTQAKTG